LIGAQTDRPSPGLVLTAGHGTRLRPLTALRAKPAVPVAGQPLIRRILAWLAAQGLRDLVLNLHHRPETITAAVGDGAGLGLRVRYSWEQPVLGTAGGPRHALPLVDADRFWIVNGDTLTDVDLAAIERQHLQSGALVTMAGHSQPGPTGGGVRVDGWVTGFTPGERPRITSSGAARRVARLRDLADNTPAESISDSTARSWSGAESAHSCRTPRSRHPDAGRLCGPRSRSPASSRRPAAASLRRCAVARVAACAPTRTIVWDDVTIGEGVTPTLRGRRRGAARRRLTLERRVIVPTGCAGPRHDEVAGDCSSPPSERLTVSTPATPFRADPWRISRSQQSRRAPRAPAARR
jgi:hypothetical protein